MHGWAFIILSQIHKLNHREICESKRAHGLLFANLMLSVY